MRFDDLKQGNYIGNSDLSENQKQIIWQDIKDKKVAYFELLQYSKNLENYCVEEENRPDYYLTRLNKTVVRLERLLLWNENDGWCTRFIKKWMNNAARGKEPLI